MEEETISHLFYYCTHIQDIWNQVQIYFNDCFHFLQSTPQTAIFGFHDIDNDAFLIENYILLSLKSHIYNARKYEFLLFNSFRNEISNIKNLEKTAAVNNQSKCKRFRKKCHRIENKVPYDLIGNKQKNQLYKNLERDGGWDKDCVILWRFFLSFSFISFYQIGICICLYI